MEPTYEYIKGRGWILLSEEAYFDRDGVAYSVKIVDLPEIGDKWIVLYGGEPDDWLRSHIQQHSFVYGEGFTDADLVYYNQPSRRSVYKFAILTPL